MKYKSQNSNNGKARSKYARVFLFTKSIGASALEGGDQNAHIVSMLSQNKEGEENELSEEQKKEVVRIERDTYSNMALVFFKEKNYSKCIEKAVRSRYLALSLTAPLCRRRA